MSRTSGSSRSTGPARELVDDVVERPLPAERAGGDLAGERAVALVGQPSRARGRARAGGRRVRSTTARSSVDTPRRARARSSPGGDRRRPRRGGPAGTRARSWRAGPRAGCRGAAAHGRRRRRREAIRVRPRATVPGAAGRQTRTSSAVRWMRTRPHRDGRTRAATAAGPRTWLWMRAAGRVQSTAPSLLRELGRVGAQALVLRRFDTRARRESVDDLDEQSRRRVAARSRSTSALVSSGPMARRRSRSIAPGVERLHDAHDRDAGLARRRR